SHLRSVPIQVSSPCPVVAPLAYACDLSLFVANSFIVCYCESAGIVGNLFVLVICLYAPQHVSASIKAGTRVECARTPDSLCAERNISLARSPMITQGAMVLPVVTRGMMDPSAIRRFSIP